MDSAMMIMHDQEPLDWDLYSPQSMYQDLLPWYCANLSTLQYQMQCDAVREHVSHKNLAAVCYGNVTADVNMICHSEVNSPHIDKYIGVGLVPVYWWSHAAIARDWYRYAQHDPSLKDLPDVYEQDFVIYNRAWGGSREYRLKFADLVIEKALVPAARISFSTHDNGTYWREHEFRNPVFRPNNDLEWLPSNLTTSSQSAGYSRQDYRICWWDVVLETLYDDQRWHLTEKILRPIACNKPFLLLSTPGALGYLRSYGFRTFHDIIDESYDLETDPVQRMTRVTEVMEYIRQLSAAERKEMQRAIRHITAYNQQRFFSDAFIQEVWQEFMANFESARQHCLASRQGRNWIDLRRRLQQDAAARSLVNQDNPRRTRQDIADLMRVCRSRR